MKLKYEFETVDMGNEVILVPIGDASKKVSGVVKLNESGLEILNLIKTGASESAIVDALAAKYENSREDLLRYVREVLDALRENGLIEE